MCGVCWKPLQELLPPTVKPVLNICGHVFHPSCLVPPQFYPNVFRCPICGHLIKETRSLHVAGHKDQAKFHDDKFKLKDEKPKYGFHKANSGEGEATCGNNRATLDVDAFHCEHFVYKGTSSIHKDENNSRIVETIIESLDKLKLDLATLK